MKREDWTDKSKWPQLVGKKARMVVTHESERITYEGFLKLDDRGYYSVADDGNTWLNNIISIAPLEEDMSTRVEDLKPGDVIGPMKFVGMGIAGCNNPVRMKMLRGNDPEIFMYTEDAQSLIDAFGVTPAPVVPTIVKGKVCSSLDEAYDDGAFRMPKEWSVEGEQITAVLDSAIEFEGKRGEYGSLMYDDHHIIVLKREGGTE